jgi:PKD repeat protein
MHPGSYADLDICAGLYASGGTTAPYYAFKHGANVAGETCVTDAGSSISGLSFYTGTAYPSQFQGSLFFADYSRKCIFVMLRGANGLPDPTQVHPFINGAANPVQLKAGAAGDIFYVDFDGGRLHRVVYTRDGPPHAVAEAVPTSGKAPLHVQFDGTGSSDPNGGPLIYAWDLDGDGAFDDSAAPNPSWTYQVPDTVDVRLQVTDADGLWDRAPVTINVTGTLTQYVSDLPFVSAINGWGPVERDQSNGEQAAGDGGPIRINGTSYARGLGGHAISDVVLDIPDGCTTFRATIGIDDEAGAKGSVRFKVYGDGISLFSSALKRGSDAGQAITVDVTSRSQLRLVIGNGGDGTSYDHGDWAGARLTCTSG